MKVLIPTIGSRGDVQPFIALSQGLAREGYSVTIASHPVMKTLVESQAVKFAPIGPDIDLAREVARIQSRSHNPMLGLMRGMRFGFEMLKRSQEDILRLCKESELVVVSAQSAAGKNEADLLGIPSLSVTLMPWAIPWDDPARSLPKRMLYGVMDGAISLMTTRPLNQIRKGMGLPPVGKEGFGSSRQNLIPVSPAVYQPNPFWGTNHHLVGYWYVEEPQGWRPPPDLLAFLEVGDPPLAVSLGAMSLGDQGASDEAAKLFVEAIRLSGARAIIQGLDAGFAQLDTPAEVYPAAAIPHSWLFPRCIGVVHHGGFGTTAAGLRAGIPALVIPHLGDQFYWGQILHDLGVGLEPIPHSKLNANRLATSFRTLMGEEALRETAVVLGEKIRAEQGVENAVRLITQEFA